MGNKRFAENPLLYIQQPTISTPEVPMQHHYYTPKQNHQPQEQDNKNVAVKHTRPLRRNYPVKNEAIIEETESESLAEVENKEIPNQSKFKDMTLKQKVSYFIDRPSHAPEMRCEIKTDEKKVQGIITGEEDEDVLIRIGRRSSSSKIPFDEITDIRMLGF